MNEETLTQASETESTEDAFLSGWDEGAAETVETADQPEQQAEQVPESAEQPEQATEQTEQAEPETAETPQTEPQTEPQPERSWTLRHLDEERSVNEQELIALAQQGMDYSRIREKYDESKPVMELFRQYAQQANMSIPEYVKLIRTRAKEAEGESAESARRSVEMEDREAAVSAREAALAQKDSETQKAQQVQQAAAERRQREIEQFRTTYPEAASHPESIPKEVFEQAAKVGLTAAYAMHELAQARQEAAQAKAQLEAAELSGKNRSRATGSMKSAGEGTAGKDPFLEGWNS